MRKAASFVDRRSVQTPHTPRCLVDYSAWRRFVLPFGDMSPQLEPVASALSQQNNIVAAWVFGSVARGTARPDSDIDIALLLGRARTGTIDDIPCLLAAELEEVAGRRVDIVVVDEADPDLVHRVLRDGILLLDRNRSVRIAFEVRMRNMYFDLLPQRRRIREAALLRARRAGP